MRQRDYVSLFYSTQVYPTYFFFLRPSGAGTAGRGEGLTPLAPPSFWLGGSGLVMYLNCEPPQLEKSWSAKK